MAQDGRDLEPDERVVLALVAPSLRMSHLDDATVECGQHWRRDLAREGAPVPVVDVLRSIQDARAGELVTGYTDGGERRQDEDGAFPPSVVLLQLMQPGLRLGTGQVHLPAGPDQRPCLRADDVAHL